ncbi:MAG: hypothetical protein QX198_07945 [Methylococcaceae bacterium]
MRIQVDNRDKQLIHKYWYAASKEMQAQLLKTKRRTIDIEHAELQDFVGYLAMECNYCKSKSLAVELNELCDRLECEL